MSAKLTRQQLEELKLLSLGRRSTRGTLYREGAGSSKGAARARISNALSAKRLARFCEEDGSRREISIAEVLASYGNPHPFCEITEAGRLELRVRADSSSNKEKRKR